MMLRPKKLEIREKRQNCRRAEKNREALVLREFYGDYRIIVKLLDDNYCIICCAP
jgi:hypothetical protein